MTEIKINQIVKGKVGYFVVLGFRTIAGENYAQVKSYDMASGRAARGEMALPVSILSAV